MVGNMSTNEKMIMLGAVAVGMTPVRVNTMNPIEMVDTIAIAFQNSSLRTAKTACRHAIGPAPAR
jgi:hypothetical protein